TLTAEHAGERPAATLADHDHDLALARLIDPQPTIAAVLAIVGGLHIAAEIAAVDFRPLALAADCGLPNLACHCFAHLVSQNERRLVLRPEIAAERQHALALDLVAEDRDGHQIGPQRHLMKREQRAAGDAEILAAGFAAPARRTVWSTSQIDRCAAA